MARSQWHRFYVSAIAAPPERATIDVHIHYSLEAEDGITTVTRWLVLDIAMPAVFVPLRPLINRSVEKAFDKENERTMAALKDYAEARSSGGK